LIGGSRSSASIVVLAIDQDAGRAPLAHLAERDFYWAAIVTFHAAFKFAILDDAQIPKWFLDLSRPLGFGKKRPPSGSSSRPIVTWPEVAMIFIEWPAISDRGGQSDGGNFNSARSESFLSLHPTRTNTHWEQSAGAAAACYLAFQFFRFSTSESPL
jgi:hypothetical protein